MPPGTVYAIVDAGGMYHKLVISIVKTYLLKVRYVTRTLKSHLSFAGSLDALSGRGHARIFLARDGLNESSCFFIFMVEFGSC